MTGNPSYMSQQPDNKEIVSMLKTDRRKAVGLLFEMHYVMMCKAAYRITNDEAIAEDLVQDIFVKLYENPGSLQVAASPAGYLRRTAVNRAIDHYRKHSKISKVNIDQVFDLNTRERADEDIEFSEVKSAVKAAIEKLPQQCKVVFVLKRKEGMSNKEVAEYLGISVKTVENQSTKAMKRLREMLGPLLSVGIPIAIGLIEWQLWIDSL